MIIHMILVLQPLDINLWFCTHLYPCEPFMPIVSQSVWGTMPTCCNWTLFCLP